MKVGIYIKGRFRGNPRGPGEAAAIIEYIDKHGRSYKRAQKIQIEYDTRNAMYLKICIAAVRILVKPCKIIIYTDCDYIRDICRLGRLEQWKEYGWKRTNGKQPANLEEWKQLYMLAQIHTITFSARCNQYEKELEKILECEVINCE